MNPVQTTMPDALKHLMKDDVLDGPKAKNNLGKDDFMRLLLTQLQNQDPLKPMEHQEFIAQLAQFGSLEQLTNIGSGIQNLRTGIGENAKLQALSMIGKQVQAAGQELEHHEGENLAIPFKSSPDLKLDKVLIADNSGKVIREIDLTKGQFTEIIWDGKTQEGRMAPSGKYTFKVEGLDGNGNKKNLSSDVSGKVVGMEMNGDNPVLQVQTHHGVMKLDINKVRSVTENLEQPSVVAPMQQAQAPMKSAAPVMPKVSFSPEEMEDMIEQAQEAAEAAGSGSTEDIEDKPRRQIGPFFDFQRIGGR